MQRIILDASALIAVICEEKGAEKVEPYLPIALISAVNFAEVASFLSNTKGLESKSIKSLLDDLALDVIHYDQEQAYITADLRTKTKHCGLSLGDRACLALAITQQHPVLTADKTWAKLNSKIDIRLIR